ncbi:MAG: class I SAM-dependent methyltransferase, partial [Phycisphaerae bacterium]|nr:class I SAM-dependent methyltransferase [Phycisphaerae bacterium]
AHRVHPDRAHFDILDWAAPETQQLRFEILTKNVALRGQSLLDVGCGLGDLVTYLEKQNVSVDYTGVDVVEQMVERAEHLHPSRRFECADIFNNPAALDGEKFDVVFCSGAMNLDLGNNLEFAKVALPAMLSHTRGTLAVNMLHARIPAGEPQYFAYNPDYILSILKPLCSEVQLLDDYLVNDFTVIAKI